MPGSRILGSALLIGLFGIAGIAAWREYRVAWRWRTLSPTVREFLIAARARDTANLQRLTAGPEPVARALALATQEPAQLDTLLASLRFAWGDEPGPDTVIVTYRTRASVCRYADGHPDEYQVRFVGAEPQRRIDYAGIMPC